MLFNPKEIDSKMDRQRADISKEYEDKLKELSKSNESTATLAGTMHDSQKLYII